VEDISASHVKVYDCYTHKSIYNLKDILYN